MKIANIGQTIKSKKIIAAFFIILLVAGILKFTVFSNKTASESAIVKKGNLTQELTLSGKISADEDAVLQFQTGGLLAWVGVKEGDRVEKFQGIASLDQRQLQKTLEKKLNDYMTTRWDFEQTKNNKNDVLFGQQRFNLETANKSNFSGKPEADIVNDMIKRLLEKSQFTLDNSVLDVELADLSLQLANISSPISGIVTRIDSPFPGLNITPSQAQFEIVNPDSVFLDVSADQTDVVNLKEGEFAKLVFDSYPNEKTEGYIKNISFTPKTDETGTVYKIKIALSNINNINYKYRLGMTADAIFKIEEKDNVLILPLKYVKSDNKGKYVLLKDNKKAYVQTGLETDSDIEITKGLLPGERVYD
ncbi:MAG: efflux RND transporter periplasmic adaptor subunit [Candidatus Levybacteria bacterium]|nr:efflux RND transporter periplasmic adaptor subunit [Candidatus Levybacteria bacterium]